MHSSISTFSRFLMILFISVLLISGCSDSGDAQPQLEAGPASIDGENGTADDGGAIDMPDDPAVPDDPAIPDPLVQNSTLVNFDITVPAYVSNALQVQLVWGDKIIAAMWVGDEHWSASDDFPTNSIRIR